VFKAEESVRGLSDNRSAGDVEEAMKTIDLNCDMGESFGVYHLGMDAEVVKYVSSANVACGFHAGDPVVMNGIVRLAVQHGVAVGAHPGFPDLLGFGRRNMDCGLDEIKDYIIYQVGAVRAFCVVHGCPLRHVKPHGSLYNMAVEKESIARAVAQAVAAFDPSLLLVTLAGGKAELMARIGREEGVKMVFEAFPDRAYTSEGTLVSRRMPGSVIHDPGEVSERAVMMVKEGRVIAIDGSSLPLEVDTLCVHGDTPNAADLARSIRECLLQEGITVTPMGKPD
jgi:5-oxoprolinase (ATP-hydrolysing) subunit A